VSVRARAVLSVGSNLGDRLGTLQGCVQAIGRLPDTDVLAISPVYQTAPVGGPPQPDYLNAVLLVATAQSPRDLLHATQRIEAAYGRVRAERFGPRTLDVDIIPAPEDSNFQRLADALDELGAPPTAVDSSFRDLDPRDSFDLARARILKLATTAGDLDVLNSALGAPPYADLRGRAVEVEVRGTPVRVASLDDVISMKRASGRPRDLRDIADLTESDTRSD